MTKIYTLKHPDTGRLKTYGKFKWKYKNDDIV